MRLVVWFCAFLGWTSVAMAQTPNANPATVEKALFAGGCFWSMQPPFDRVPGVLSTRVGYAGGSQANPTYKQVASGETDHREVIEITFDPAQVSYASLLEVFWRNISPVQRDGQFLDVGDQYTTAIYALNDQQQKAAEASKMALTNSGKFSKPIATVILPAATFWPAEEYHQKYYRKNPMGYGMYRATSGRASYLLRVWGSGK